MAANGNFELALWESSINRTCSKLTQTGLNPIQGIAIDMFQRAMAVLPNKRLLS